MKLFSISEDNGRSWSNPQPLTYDDDKYIYLPRTGLHLIEIDEHTLRAKRETLTVIEEKHPEHHELIRYSNWQSLQDRQTGNLILFMGLHMSEFCPLRFGYDVNLYRYEVDLPPAATDMN